jgi:hypothetical protein
LEGVCGEVGGAAMCDTLLVFETEQKLIQWLKKSIGTIPGKRENWSTTVLEIVSLKDLFLISGVNSPE